MPSCANCGHFVTDAYERVWAREGEQVQCCPYCPDLKRDSTGRPRERLSPATHGAPTRHQDGGSA